MNQACFCFFQTRWYRNRLDEATVVQNDEEEGWGLCKTVDMAETGGETQEIQRRCCHRTNRGGGRLGRMYTAADMEENQIVRASNLGVFELQRRRGFFRASIVLLMTRPDQLCLFQLNRR